jgi:hypothetical protein
MGQRPWKRQLGGLEPEPCTFMRELAKQAGHDLDFRVISKERMIRASIAANEGGNPGMMRRLFKDAINLSDVRRSRGLSPISMRPGSLGMIDTARDGERSHADALRDRLASAEAASTRAQAEAQAAAQRAEELRQAEVPGRRGAVWRAHGGLGRAGSRLWSQCAGCVARAKPVASGRSTRRRAGNNG